MKKIFLLLAMILAIIPARAQIITGCEYFFDTDPGIGNGTSVSVTSGDSVILSTTIPTAALSSGFHKLFFRVQNVDGVWSLYEGRNFFIQDAVTPNTAQLTNAEYFFDTDPGVGNGTAFTVSAGDSLLISTTVSTAALGDGFHKLFVRAKNADGKWSLYEGRTFYIQAAATPNTALLTNAEYFFDTDPGVDAGTPFTVTAGDSIVLSTTVATTSLGNGFHKLFVRAKNADNKWSLYEGRTFYLQEPTVDTSLQVQIDYAEYFFDTDPGTGNGISMAITPGDSIDANFIIPESLALGLHQMVIRVKTSLNDWSLSEGREFRIGWPSVPEIDPNHATLFQNYPNPFSSSTSISFNLLKQDRVVIIITDLLGKTVKEINLDQMTPGEHSVVIHKNELQSGCYFYKMITSDYNATKQMVVLK